jgi:hypothetical protein
MVCFHILLTILSTPARTHLVLAVTPRNDSVVLWLGREDEAESNVTYRSVPVVALDLAGSLSRLEKSWDQYRSGRSAINQCQRNVGDLPLHDGGSEEVFPSFRHRMG